MANIDNPDFVTGQGSYGIDATMEGMVYASIEHSPVLGSKIVSYDASAALAMPGVKRVVQLAAGPIPPGFESAGGLAVIADNTWVAAEARKKLKIKWDLGANQNYDSAAYRTAMEAQARQPGKTVRSVGNANEALTRADKVVEATYYVPHLAHATMEPPSCLAVVTDEGCDIWAPTQHPQAAQGTVAQALGLDPAQVRVNVTLLGGGFGRKSKPDFIVEAALLAKEVGAPVKLTWTREDDIRHDYYHSTCAQYLRAGLDKKGNATAWLHRLVFPSINTTFAADVQEAMPFEMGGATELPYRIDNISCEYGAVDAHVRIGWLRSVHNINQAFAINSFMGELAAAAGRDQKDYLLELIGKPQTLKIEGVAKEKYPFNTGRLRNVIELVADKAGWGRAPKGRRALGIAAHYSFYSYIAQVADVEVDENGAVTVHAVHCAVDCGTVVNPDRVTAQVEGAIIYGLSAALHGAITAKGGQVEQSNFHDYPVLRLNETPEIHVHIVNSDAAPTGIGEPGTPPVAPAFTNAIFNATGVRVREIPVRAEWLRA